MFALLKLVDKEREGDKRLDNGRREGLPHGRVVRRGGRNERLGPGGLPSARVNPILSYTAGGPVGLTAHNVASFVKEELWRNSEERALLSATYPGGLGGNRCERDV